MLAQYQIRVLNTVVSFLIEEGKKMKAIIFSMFYDLVHTTNWPPPAVADILPLRVCDRMLCRPISQVQEILFAKFLLVKEWRNSIQVVRFFHLHLSMCHQLITWLKTKMIRNVKLSRDIQYERISRMNIEMNLSEISEHWTLYLQYYRPTYSIEKWRYKRKC